MCMTGDGLTITKGGSALPFRVVSLSEFPMEAPTIDDDDLSGAVGTLEKKCPGKRIVHERWEGVAVYDTTPANIPLPDTGASEEIIVTFQPLPGESTGGTMTGDGWITMGGVGQQEKNERSVVAFAILFEGGVAPASMFAAGTP